MKEQMYKFSMIFLIFSLPLSFLAATPISVSAALGISSVQPNTASNAVNTTLTIIGEDFQPRSIVSISNFGSLTTTFVDNATLQAILPPGLANGLYTVMVTNPGGDSVSLPDGLTVYQPAIPAQPTETAQPPVATYERPLIVVVSYGTSSDTVTLGQEFDLYVKLYNAGQKFANNVVINFTPSDLIPRGTGGVLVASGIAPDNRYDIAQPMTLRNDLWGQLLASVDMLVTYTDQAGTAYAENFVISIPIVQPRLGVPTSTPTPTATTTPLVVKRPQLVITNYTTSIAPLQPGLQFILELEVANLGNDLAKRITMVVGGGSAGTVSGTPDPGGISGASGEFTNFAPVGASNVQSLGDLLVGNSMTAYQSLIVNVSTNPGAFPLKISFIYLNETGQIIVDDQVITLLVYSLPNVDINFYRDPGLFFTGQSAMLPLQIVNLGRKSVVLGNMRVDAQNAQLTNNTILVGALEAGGYYTLDASIIPELPGTQELVVTIDFTDDFNQAQRIVRTITLNVLEMEMPGPFVPGPGDGGEETLPPQMVETFWQKVMRFFKGFLGLDSAPPSIQYSGEMTPGESEEPVIAPGAPLKGP